MPINFSESFLRNFRSSHVALEGILVNCFIENWMFSTISFEQELLDVRDRRSDGVYIVQELQKQAFDVWSCSLTTLFVWDGIVFQVLLWRREGLWIDVKATLSLRLSTCGWRSVTSHAGKGCSCSNALENPTNGPNYHEAWSWRLQAPCASSRGTNIMGQIALLERSSLRRSDVHVEEWDPWLMKDNLRENSCRLLAFKDKSSQSVWSRLGGYKWSKEHTKTIQIVRWFTEQTSTNLAIHDPVLEVPLGVWSLPLAGITQAERAARRASIQQSTTLNLVAAACFINIGVQLTLADGLTPLTGSPFAAAGKKGL